MYLFHFLILLACVYESQQGQNYNPKIFRTEQHAKTNHRILELMRSYYEEATARITYMNPMRFMYEESPFYEMGYITGEIIERYRKVVEHTQKPVKFINVYTLFDVLKHVELVQKLYFELYHLVRMMHETPRKWRGVKEFSNIEQMAGPDLMAGKGGIDGKGKKFVLLSQKQLSELFSVQQTVIEQQKNRLKEKKRQRKKFNKLRQAYLNGLITDMHTGVKRKHPRPFPIDYGWEIYHW